MDLLPKSRSDFSTKDYWETFFKKRGTKAFEWYGEYSSYCGLLAKYVKTKDVILEIGCGNSDLGSQMYDFGYKNITCIDISARAIQQMKQKHQRSRPDLKLFEMDLFHTTFSDGEFSVVLDKGTLDAIFSEESLENEEKVSKMFEELSRLLKFGGRYVCFSLAQSFIANKMVNYFSQMGWLTRVCLIPNETRDTDKDFCLPVFMFVLTKFKKLEGSKAILETAFIGEKVERLGCAEEVLRSIEEMQNYALVRQNINSSSKKHDEELCVNLHSSSQSSSAPRYSIYIVEAAIRTTKKFGIFIVPQGRELEWLFSTTEGRRELHKSCGYERLLVVLLSRFHQYEDIEAVKAELSSKVLELAPPNVSKQSPYLTLGNSVNLRTTREEGESGESGAYVVEDVSVDDKIFRRLVFLSMPDNIQSEVLLARKIVRGTKKAGKRKESMEPEHSFLPSNYYKSTVAGLALLCHQLKERSELKILMLGLGGGLLTMFLLKALPMLKVEAVEVDETVVKIGRRWFGLGGDDGVLEGEGGRLKVVVDDALKFVQQANEEGGSYDMLVLDIDNKDHQTGFSFPPKEFVELAFIQSCCNIISARGIFVLNLVTRSESNREMVVQRLKECFEVVLSRAVSEEVNEVFYCIKGDGGGVVNHGEGDGSDGKVGDDIKVGDDVKLENLKLTDSEYFKNHSSEFIKKLVEDFEFVKGLIKKHNNKYLEAINDIDMAGVKFI